MWFSVLVEPVAGGFQARTGEPFSLTAAGSSRDGALQKLHELIKARLATGAEIVPLEVGPPEPLPLPPPGIFKDNPLFDEWQEAIAEYRRKIDEEDLRAVDERDPEAK
jgi:hypothetical protein